MRDCVMVAADAVRELYGYDPASEYRRLAPRDQVERFRQGALIWVPLVAKQQRWPVLQEVANAPDGAIGLARVAGVVTTVHRMRGIWCTAGARGAVMLLIGVQPFCAWDTSQCRL